MPRLIPGKTKVSIELFKGVTLGDVIVAGIAMAMVIFVLVSNLPWKGGILIGIAALTALLLFRMDEQPNFVYILHILTFIGYKRRFERVRNDQMLEEVREKGEKEAAFDQAFGEGSKRELTRAEKRRISREQKAEARAEEKARLQAGSDDDRAVASAVKKTGKKEARQEAKAREKARKEEDRILKSKDASEEEKEAIRERRKEESRVSMQKLAEAKDAEKSRADMEEIIPFTGIKDGYIEYLNKSYYGAVFQIDPVEFRFFSQHRRNNSIENCLGRVLRSVHPGYSANIVKLERPIMYDRYLDKEYKKLEMLSQSYENGVLEEDELKARVEVEYDRINEVNGYCTNRKITDSFYYLVLFESDKRQLENQIREAEQLLKNGEMTVKRLDDKELAIFLKYSNQIDFDERDIEKIRPEDYHIWAQPNIVDIKPRRVEVNHIITHNFRVVNYPTTVGDAWLASVMSMPGTKVVVKCTPMDRGKAIRNIDHSLTELRGQWSATGVDSRRMEIETHISTLQDLLATLQNDSESLLETNIYITAYDIVSTRNNYKIPQPPESQLPNFNEMKKNIRRAWQESGFRLNNMEFDQVQAFIGSQVSALDPLAKDGRGISSNTVAACFPWIFAHVSDEGGIKLGESDGIPVFIDFFRRDSERVNSNMVIVGKSGSGKSYATKSLLTNLAAEDAKIFILDPENEYSELAANLHGQIINVGNAQYGRLNPFHIITALDDDEAGEDGPSGSYATHLQFLEEFFKQIMPDCEKDAMEYLNTLVDHMYMSKDITADTDLSKLGPADYPIFDDLYDEVLQEFQSSDNPFTRDLLRTLMNYIAKFSTGGRNANIWNGPSTVTTDENFTVFNFQSMLANRNNTIANAQMLLVLKYIDNEIIKNRDYNTKYHANRKIVVVIDEAHVFIDAKFPIALDFMFQLAKRIRKYNGMQIVITQNIKDFVGSEELARKSTAIINACQYSFIFSLAPNDMSDLVTLYEKAGGINETEQEEIVQAPRGQAFVVMSPTSRSSFQIETAPGISEMFESRDYQSRYFSGVGGDENWEAFVGVSRALHEENARQKQPRLIEGAEEDARPAASGKGVSFTEFEEDEYEEASKAAAGGGVTFHIDDDDDLSLDDIEEFDSALDKRAKAEQAVARADAAGAGLAGLASSGDQTMAVFSMIADALGRMADAAEGTAPRAAQKSAAEEIRPRAAEETVPQLREKDEEIIRLEKEKDEEIRRLKEELEKARSAEAAAEAASEEEPEAAGEEPSEEPEGYVLPDDEGYSEEEEEGDLMTLFASAGEDEEEEDEWDEDDGWDADEDEDESVDVESIEDEPVSDLDTDEYDEDDEDDEDEDDDFMSSFCSFAAHLRDMSLFERMRCNGQETMTISLQDLADEVKAQQDRRRKMRETA